MRCDTMTIEEFESNMLFQVGKHIEINLIDDLYNSKICYFECIEIAMGDYINKDQIKTLNKLLLYTLNTSIATYNVGNNMSCYYFTKNFLEKEKNLTLLRLETIRKGLLKRSDKYINEQEVLHKVDGAISLLKSISTAKELRKITNG